MVEFGFYDINEILHTRINDFKIARNKCTHIEQEEKLKERGVRKTLGAFNIGKCKMDIF